MSSRPHCLLLVLVCAAAVSACGGNSSPAPPATVVQPPAAAAALAVSTPTLALAVSGLPRRFVITNVGGQTALDLSVQFGPPLTGIGALASDCTSLAPGASCTLDVTPSAFPSAAPGDTAPAPIALSLAGSNTNTLALSVWVLDFGSVYQGGYVFHLDDATPATGGVGGKVMALADLPGIPPHWGPSDAATLLGLSPTDGAANTAAIVQTYGPPAHADPILQYPAWACDNSGDAGFNDWYLPAICELGYDRNGYGSGCGTDAAPTLPDNIQSRLVDPGLASAGLGYLQQYWSSTASPGEVWLQIPLPFDLNEFQQHLGFWTEMNPARCVRALTP